MYGVSERTAKRWLNTNPTGKKNAAKKKEQHDQAVSDLMLTYLRTLLTTLNVQVEFFSDTDWLAEQTAGEIAILHGVLADKGSRIMDILVEIERQQHRYIEAQSGDLNKTA